MADENETPETEPDEQDWATDIEGDDADGADEQEAQ
jgi:hypothetical protein